MSQLPLKTALHARFQVDRSTVLFLVLHHLLPPWALAWCEVSEGVTFLIPPSVFSQPGYLSSLHMSRCRPNNDGLADLWRIDMSSCANDVRTTCFSLQPRSMVVKRFSSLFFRWKIALITVPPRLLVCLCHSKGIWADTPL